MNKILNILRTILIFTTTFIFSIMLVLSAMITEKIFLIIISIIFAFILIGTTSIDIFKKRSFNKLYKITTAIVSLIILITILRPILDVLYIEGLDISNKLYIFNNCVINFYQNVFVYALIFILMFIGNYINYKI